MSKYICVDFDGTIVDHRFPEIGQPVPGALNWLARFAELGGKLILFTMRSDRLEGSYLSEAVYFLKDQGIELYGINHNPDQHTWTHSPKAYGHVYIDDAAAGCPLIHPAGFARPCVDWGVIGPKVAGLLK